MSRDFPLGPLIAALGAALLAVSLFVDWWEGVTAFTAYELLDLVLLGLALVALASLAGGLRLVRPVVDPGTALAVALIAVVVVVSQILNDPPAIAGSERGYEAGIWLALTGAGLMLLGSLLSWAHISLAVDVRPRTGARRAADPDAPTVREPAAPPAAAPGPEAPRGGGPEPL